MFVQRRKRVKWCLNPNGKTWSSDSSKFGQRMLEKMGWKEGQGLGRELQGEKEHLKVSYKCDKKGFGCKNFDTGLVHHQDKFDNLLTTLSASCGSSDLNEKDSFDKNSLEQQSKRSKVRLHYQKFTRGKDVSKYSAKDLACILGKTVMLKNKVAECELDKVKKYTTIEDGTQLAVLEDLNHESVDNNRLDNIIILENDHSSNVTPFEEVEEERVGEKKKIVLKNDHSSNVTTFEEVEEERVRKKKKKKHEEKHKREVKNKGLVEVENIQYCNVSFVDKNDPDVKSRQINLFNVDKYKYRKKPDNEIGLLNTIEIHNWNENMNCSFQKKEEIVASTNWNENMNCSFQKKEEIVASDVIVSDTSNCELPLVSPLIVLNKNVCKEIEFNSNTCKNKKQHKKNRKGHIFQLVDEKCQGSKRKSVYSDAQEEHCNVSFTNPTVNTIVINKVYGMQNNDSNDRLPYKKKMKKHTHEEEKLKEINLVDCIVQSENSRNETVELESSKNSKETKKKKKKQPGLYIESKEHSLGNAILDSYTSGFKSNNLGGTDVIVFTGNTTVEDNEQANESRAVETCKYLGKNAIKVRSNENKSKFNTSSNLPNNYPQPFEELLDNCPKKEKYKVMKDDVCLHLFKGTNINYIKGYGLN